MVLGAKGRRGDGGAGITMLDNGKDKCEAGGRSAEGVGGLVGSPNISWVPHVHQALCEALRARPSRC